MQVTTDLSTQLQRYLNLSSAELKTTANNMANVDTPGYSTKGFDFPSVMRNLLAESGDGESSEAANLAASSPRLEDVDGLVARPDGNNVSMEREGLKMAEAQLKFKTGVELLKHEFTRVLDAIHADSK